MDNGMATYALANLILADKRRSGEQNRLLSELRSIRREERRLQRLHAEQNARWSLEWANNGLTGKPVSLVNQATGEKKTGRDPSDWDRALGAAARRVGVSG